MTFPVVVYCQKCEKTFQRDSEENISSVEYAKNHKCEICDGVLQAELDENRM